MMNHSIQYSFEDAPNSQPLLGKKMDLRKAKQTFYFSEERREKILCPTGQAHLSEPESCRNETEHTRVLGCGAPE
jgi:hypothetical protein